MSLKRLKWTWLPSFAYAITVANAPAHPRTNGLSKAITIQLIGEDSYRLRPYLRTLERAAYTIIASILRSFKVPADRIQP